MYSYNLIIYYNGCSTTLYNYQITTITIHYESIETKDMIESNRQVCDYIPKKKKIAEAIRCLLKRRKLRLSDEFDFEISQQCSWNWS